MNPQSVLFVCLGNICRSPIAEGVFWPAPSQRLGTGASDWTVDSAGAFDYHTEEAPDQRSQTSALRQGVNRCIQASRPFQQDDFEKFNHILVMDSSKHVNGCRRMKNPIHRAKVQLMLEPSFPGKYKPVPDPYYGGEDGFEQVFNLLAQASEDWLDRWT